MMRKLVVTIFAFSFAAVGCGSDNGTTTTDAYVPKTDVQLKLDVVSTSGPETQPDVSIPDVAQPDIAIADVLVVTDQAQQPVDQGTQVDQVVVTVDGQPDSYVSPVDGPKPTVDGGVDGGTAPVDGHSQVDSSPTVDGGVDGGSVG